MGLVGEWVGGTGMRESERWTNRLACSQTLWFGVWVIVLVLVLGLVCWAVWLLGWLIGMDEVILVGKAVVLYRQFGLFVLSYSCACLYLT